MYAGIIDYLAMHTNIYRASILINFFCILRDTTVFPVYKTDYLFSSHRQTAKRNLSEKQIAKKLTGNLTTMIRVNQDIFSRAITSTSV